MSVLVAGTVTRDTLHLPSGTYRDMPGGSALYGALGASLFTSSAIVGCAGVDLGEADLELLQRRRIALTGLKRHPGATFAWEARYSADLDDRETLRRDLGVGGIPPIVPGDIVAAASWICLGSTDPAIQRSVLEQTSACPYTIDTMAHWTRDEREGVLDLVKGADTLFVSEDECLLLGATASVPTAAARLLEYGASNIVVKAGPAGVQLFTGERVVSCPAFPVSAVVDPTGAGDAFAGAYTASRLLEEDPQISVARGVVGASFAVEGVSFSGFGEATEHEVARRFAWMMPRAVEHEGVR